MCMSCIATPFSLVGYYVDAARFYRVTSRDSLRNPICESNCYAFDLIFSIFFFLWSFTPFLLVLFALSLFTAGIERERDLLCVHRIDRYIIRNVEMSKDTWPISNIKHRSYYQFRTIKFQKT
jgi:hypothetical protein